MDTILTKFREARVKNLRRIMEADGWADGAQNDVARAVLAYGALLHACKAALEREDNADDELGDLLRAAIEKAEGK